MNRTTRALGVLLLASTALTGHAFAAAQQDDTQARLRALEDELANVNAQLGDLKRSQSDQYTDVNRQLNTAATSGVVVSLKGGRPTFSSADGDFSLAIRTLVQLDWGYYSQSAHAATLPAAFGPDLSSGTNFRRVYLGIQGVAFGDWSYNVNFDFGGSGGTETPGHVQSVFLQYDHFKPFSIRVGAYPPPANIEDGTSAGDTIFLERNAPSDLQRNIAGGDGRDAVSILYTGDELFGALSYTGGKVQDAGVFDEQQALLGRLSDRFWHDDVSNFVIGVNGTYVIKPADNVSNGLPNSQTTPGAAVLNSITLSDPPELTIDSQGNKLVNTGALPAKHVSQWGVEAAGNYLNFYGQAGYYGFEVDRAPTAFNVFTGPGVSSARLIQPNNNSLTAWYVQGSWIITGEQKPYNVANGAFTAPKVDHPFGFGPKAGWGAWELAARYDDLDLNSHELDNSSVITAWTPASRTYTFFNTERGGDQRIVTAELNWYPNNFVKFGFQYEYVQESRLQGPSTVTTNGVPVLPTLNGGQNFSTFAVRSQFAL
jgi:phosphate-selective porin OprO and OprP